VSRTPPPGTDVHARTIDAASADELVATAAPSRSNGHKRVVSPGERVRQYEIIRLLGEGGMGEVFLARDTRLGRRVAMKFLAGSRELTQRSLADEARATARCNHENIVVIHEADHHRGRPYIVLEYLEGVPLRQLMAGKRMAPGRVVELIVPVVRALVRAHEFELVHRDLKPENIFVTTSGTVKVLDFGLARLLSGTDDRVLLDGEMPGAADDQDTRDSAITGTLPYMAPEQFWRRGIDHRADLWAVGIILFEMLAGKHPLPRYTPEQLMGNAALLDEPMPRVSALVADVPQKLDQIIQRCLSKRKDGRYHDARELLDELEPLLPQRGGRQLAEDESPFPGLMAFQESDADRFFGRANDVAKLVAHLRERPLVGVAGPSGVGKSSFIRAGVVPSLKASGEAWEVLTLRPGRHPLESLATLLEGLSRANDGVDAWEHHALVAQLKLEPGTLGTILRERAYEKGEQILLFIDQFEELYTLVGDVDERLDFTACLAGVADDAAAPLRVVVSMRSDFLERVAEDAQFLEELTKGLVFLQPLGPDGLRKALTQPVSMLGYAFESPAMVTSMLDALAATPGALPLLQFAAAKLWDQRDRRRKMLTEASYDQMGGLAGALATHADEVIAQLRAPQQRLVRELLLRLVTPERTRAIVDIAELADLSTDAREVRTLVDQLVAARLLVVQGRGEAEGGAIELVHESLIATWPTLRRWLEETNEDAAHLDQLRAAAKQWDQKGRPQGLLWRGEAMEEARLWSLRYKGELPARERAFLSAVVSLANRAARLRAIAAVGAIAFLALLVLVGSIALFSIRRAEKSAVAEAGRAQREAEHAQREAERARGAEQKVKEQLAVIRNEQEANESARAEVEKGKGDLNAANGRLKLALGKAEEQSRRAQDAAARAQQANGKLEKLLQQERARAERLQKERNKINTVLK
jgi:serine/threonine protein kinase